MEVLTYNSNSFQEYSSETTLLLTLLQRIQEERIQQNIKVKEISFIKFDLGSLRLTLHFFLLQL